MKENKMSKLQVIKQGWMVYFTPESLPRVELRKPGYSFEEGFCSDFKLHDDKQVIDQICESNGPQYTARKVTIIEDWIENVE